MLQSEPPRRREVSPEIIAEREARAILRPLLREVTRLQHRAALQDAHALTRHSTDGDRAAASDERDSLRERVEQLRLRIAAEAADYAQTYAVRSANAAIDNLLARLGS